MSLRCRILGHDISPQYTQPEPRFQKMWNEYMKQAMVYEIFDQKCKRCGDKFRYWRFTADAFAHEVGWEK